MALVSLTNVNPYEVDRSQNIAASASLGQNISRGLQSIGQGFAVAKQKAEERAKEKEKENQERNKALAKNYSETFGELDQTIENNNFLQDTFINSGLEDKKEYTNLLTKLDDTSLSNEERVKTMGRIESIKANASNLNSAIENLNTTTASIREMAETDQISPGTDPKIIDFVTEMDNPDLAKNYSMETDDDGNRFIVGETQEGDPIRLSIDKLASGENQLRVLPRKDKGEFVKTLSDDLFKNPIYKAGENKVGAIQYVDAAQMGASVAPKIMDTLKDETSFRQISAGYGFDFDDINDLQEGIPISSGLSEAGQEGPNEDVDISDGINSEEELKGYLANMMVAEVGSDPRMNEYKQLNTSKYTQQLNEAKAAEAQAKADNIAKQKQIAEDNIKISRVNSLKSTIGEEGDFAYLQQFESQKTTNGDSIKRIIKDKKNPNVVRVVYEGGAKGATPKFDSFDLSTDEGAASLESILPSAPSTEFSASVQRKAQQYLIN